MDIEEPSQISETWQVETGGNVADTSFAELTSMIAEGALLRIDRVRKGNLRWIEAGRVPSLVAVFNAKDNGEPPTPVVTTTRLGPTTLPGDHAGNPANFSPSTANAEPVCSVHSDVRAAYICDTCGNQFCKSCPSSYGGTVKICPFCGAMCKPFELVQQARKQTATYTAAIGEGFGISDFGRALAYPFKFTTSLIMGALMFALFSLGEGAGGFGGFVMLGAALTCFLLSNTLRFGVLANTVENFSQGKITENFMPSFDDFSLWDDVIHPFFLYIGVCIASFGPLIAVGLVAFFMVAGTVGKEMNGVQSDAARTVVPDLPYAANAARQSESVKELLGKDANVQKQRVESINNGQAPAGENYNRADGIEDTEASVQRANQLIQQQQKAQAEAVVGKTPETKAEEQAELIKQILGYGALFLGIGGVCLLWSLFYFPAACAVAGYTRSFTATLNLSVGFDTIRRLGLDYVKILLMCLVIALMSVAVSVVLSAVFVAFDLPSVGNLPARFVGSIFGFYFSVVFSCILGFALYKAGDRLKLYR